VEFGRDLDPVTFQRLVQGLKARDPAGWIDRVPLVQAARAKLGSSIAALGGAEFDPAYPERHPSVMRVQKELDDAFLHLGYTEIRAPVSGFVNRRSVHPGDQVQAGQALLAIQPLDDVYVVANFKETQLADLRIGQSVAIHVDAYPGRPVRGRVGGFAPATGASSSLLPPENATGNYVKVVQRIPVRIDLAELNPTDTPLFVGMSVIPAVDIKTPPTGPDAGARLRTQAPTAAAVREARR